MQNKRLKLKTSSAEHKQFNQVFNLELSSMVHPLFGLDVVTLDCAIQVPSGTSTAEWIEQHTDAETVAYVVSLI